MKFLTKLINLLEPEDLSSISKEEETFRYILQLLFRLLCASLLTWIIFDFLFSSIWMHGYIWTLNLPLEKDLSDLSASYIVDYQLTVVSKLERLVHAITSTLSIAALLICCGFANGQNKTIWNLFSVSTNVGVICGFIRSLQMKTRLFSCLHEGFYCYFITFLVGMICTIQFQERFPSRNIETVKKVEEACELEDKKVNYAIDSNNNVEITPTSDVNS